MESRSDTHCPPAGGRRRPRHPPDNGPAARAARRRGEPGDRSPRGTTAAPAGPRRVGPPARALPRPRRPQGSPRGRRTHRAGVQPHVGLHVRLGLGLDCLLGLQDLLHGHVLVGAARGLGLGLAAVLAPLPLLLHSCGAVAAQPGPGPGGAHPRPRPRPSPASWWLCAERRAPPPLVNSLNSHSRRDPPRPGTGTGQGQWVPALTELTGQQESQHGGRRAARAVDSGKPRKASRKKRQ